MEYARIKERIQPAEQHPSLQHCESLTHLLTIPSKPFDTLLSAYFTPSHPEHKELDSFQPATSLRTQLKQRTFLSRVNKHFHAAFSTEALMIVLSGRI